jgi:uncharacterized membrane protein YfcA
VELPLGAAPLALFAATLLATGVAAGLLAGLLGVGGGIVIVPVLYHLFGALGVDPAVRMHVAVGTSLATIVVTAYRSLASHRAHGAVDTELLRRWAPAVAAGALVGIVGAARLRGGALSAVFGAVALLVSAHMAFGRSGWRVAQAPPGGPGRFAAGGGVGLLSVMMGLGGGTLGVPVLTLLGIPIHRAVGTAAGLGLVIAVPGAIGMALAGLGVPELPPGCIGYVNALGFALIVPATWWAAPHGARWAHRLPTVGLRRAFALFLGLTALRMLAALR